MLSFFFIFNIFLLLLIWWFCFNSRLWYESFAYQLVIFISPVLFGLFTLVTISNIFPIELVRNHKNYFYIYCSLSLLIILPQWFKLAWLQLQKVQEKNWQDNYKFIFAVFLVVLMIFAMVIFFALFYLLINSIGGESQGLLTALAGYHPIQLDFTNAIYFSFVTYFTLGYGDLIPYGGWMRIFVFLECLSSVLNTGIIALYVYNFLFSSKKEESIKESKINRYF